MDSHRWLTVMLDTLLIAVCLGTLTMMSVAKPEIMSFFGVDEKLYDLQYIAYAAGLFAAFFLGYTKLYEGGFKKDVLLAVSFAAIPQFLIPLIRWWSIVVILRFIQGFILSLIPLFSVQIAKYFLAERPLAKGIILSGIFWGGFLGAFTAGSLMQIVDWRTTFILTAILMYVMLIVWWIPAEDFTVIQKKREGDRTINVWKMKFTWIMGFTFFPAIWVIFTIAGFSASLGYSMGWTESQVSMVSGYLHMALAIWSIVFGYIGYRLSKRNISPRGLFRAIIIVMLISYALSFIGLLLYSYAMTTGNYVLASITVWVVGAIQGTGPAFWTTAPATYPEEIFPRASFALGVISNIPNIIAPTITELLAQISNILALSELTAMPLIGIIILVIALHAKLPIEEAEKTTSILID
ncbi:MFS transporter [Staphylothermus hellenicus]|uniref:Major facilitator superfamily MFS_1 n=1 Tax=Staphylothermus hellenicus (strain DSM 12710 / JCM 10830 / BK20S6-10-b1 / P8) TaxID=591019 RepID=D7DAP7_STAHD|nr:MFS transporter [Staphylothermus hellenicus]ADI31244.1 major facilitator superfamily MFS_1 [Staphylothermus hellenicus DSM 12710]